LIRDFGSVGLLSLPNADKQKKEPSRDLGTEIEKERDSIARLHQRIRDIIKAGERKTKRRKS
jgi:hypothetical protein